ncbi:MAG: enoyl-CoA hydratase-related protein [Candidatus Binatia bacterium]
MAYEDIAFAVRDQVAIVTLQRPNRLNAFSGRMGIDLAAAYRECDRNDDIRAVVVTGAGRAFCVGADMAAGAETFAKQDERSFSAAAVDVAAWEVRKPVIAAINGHAIGIGLTLAMQCDIRLIAHEAKCGFVHVRRGVIPDAYAHWSVPRAIGFARAAELFLTGRTFSGEEAAQWGLASRVLPAAEVLPAAVAIARDIAVNVAPLSAALSKRLLWANQWTTREQVGRQETALHHVVMGRPDAIEGVMAFVERRPPRWQLTVSRDWPPEWPE